VNAFTHLTAFIALVPALALARVFIGLADLIQHSLSDTPGTVRWSGLFVVLALGIATATSWEWWLLFNWREGPRLTFLTFQFLLIKPLILLVIARLLIPDVRGDADIDLEHHYFAVARWVFPLFATVALFDLPAAHLGAVDQLDASEIAPYTVTIIVWTLICASLGWTRNRSWHWTGLILLNLIVGVGQIYFEMNVLAADQ
jgi:hypothetical protein